MVLYPGMRLFCSGLERIPGTAKTCQRSFHRYFEAKEGSGIVLFGRDFHGYAGRNTSVRAAAGASGRRIVLHFFHNRLVTQEVSGIHHGCLPVQQAEAFELYEPMRHALASRMNRSVADLAQAWPAACGGVLSPSRSLAL